MLLVVSFSELARIAARRRLRSLSRVNAGEPLNPPNHRRGFQMDELSSSDLSVAAITVIASTALLAFAGGYATAWLLEQYLKGFIPKNLAHSDDGWKIDILP